MVRRNVPITLCRSSWVAAGLLLSVLLASPVQAQQAPAAAQAAPNQRLFNNDGGMVLNFIKPDKTADFEMVVSKVKEALQKSDKPENGRR